jgi:hypothetical protein
VTSAEPTTPDAVHRLAAITMALLRRTADIEGVIVAELRSGSPSR